MRILVFAMLATLLACSAPSEETAVSKYEPRIFPIDEIVPPEPVAIPPVREGASPILLEFCHEVHKNCEESRKVCANAIANVQPWDRQPFGEICNFAQRSCSTASRCFNTWVYVELEALKSYSVIAWTTPGYATHPAGVLEYRLKEMGLDPNDPASRLVEP